MQRDDTLPQRRSIRLPHFDYRTFTGYFLTICTHEKRCTLGYIADGEMQRSPLGMLVQRCWDDLPKHLSYVRVDASVVMPNHFHGIVFLEPDPAGAACCAPTADIRQVNPKSLPAVVRTFKAAVSRLARGRIVLLGVLIWQRNYYEHVVRDDQDLDNIRQYILNNPAQWEFDSENPAV
jgi:putative transposase